MRKIIKGIFVTVFLVQFGLTNAQERDLISEQIIWTEFTQKIKFNEKYTGSFSTQYRAFLDREEGYHLFFTVGVTRQLAHGFSASFGFTNLNINQFVDTDFVLVPELRPYQSIQMSLPIVKSTFSWRLMIEERFFKNASNGELISGYNQNWRFRHKVAYRQFLTEKFGLVMGSEVMINAGNIVVNIFDQHRAQLYLNCKMNNWQINAGYMHWFFQTAANRHENRHTWIIGFVHSI